MSEQHYSLDEDLHEAEEMVKGFESYLEGNEVYGRVGGGFFGGGNMPALTAGALVMRLRRLQALQAGMSLAQQSRLENALSQFEAITREWHVHYEQKLLREANSRLDAMRSFFQEATENPRIASSVYKPEQLRRTITQEILRALADLNVESADLSAKVKQTDSRLSSVANQPTGFLWDKTLEPIYPQGQYWWLYRQPREL